MHTSESVLCCFKGCIFCFLLPRRTIEEQGTSHWTESNLTLSNGRQDWCRLLLGGSYSTEETAALILAMEDLKWLLQNYTLRNESKDEGLRLSNIKSTFTPPSDGMFEWRPFFYVKVVYTEDNYAQVSTYAEFQDIFTHKIETSNEFHFTYRMPQTMKHVYPETYNGKSSCSCKVRSKAKVLHLFVQNWLAWALPLWARDFWLWRCSQNHTPGGILYSAR